MSQNVTLAEELPKEGQTTMSLYQRYSSWKVNIRVKKDNESTDLYTTALNIAPEIFNLYWNIAMSVLTSCGGTRSSFSMNDHQNDDDDDARQKAGLVACLHSICRNWQSLYITPPPHVKQTNNFMTQTEKSCLFLHIYNRMQKTKGTSLQFQSLQFFVPWPFSLPSAEKSVRASCEHAPLCSAPAKVQVEWLGYRALPGTEEPHDVTAYNMPGECHEWGHFSEMLTKNVRAIRAYLAVMNRGEFEVIMIRPRAWSDMQDSFCGCWRESALWALQFHPI